MTNNKTTIIRKFPTVKEVKGCWDCPFLETIDGCDESHRYACNSIHKSTIYNYDEKGNYLGNVILDTLDKWFEEFCTLEKL